ncbi:hypothetical protein SNEBB_001862, partial [Seison nebaliae]
MEKIALERKIRMEEQEENQRKLRARMKELNQKISDDKSHLQEMLNFIEENKERKNEINHSTLSESFKSNKIELDHDNWVSSTKLNNIENQSKEEFGIILNEKLAATSVQDSSSFCNNSFNSWNKKEDLSSSISPLDIKSENFYLEKVFQMRFLNNNSLQNDYVVTCSKEHNHPSLLIEQDKSLPSIQHTLDVTPSNKNELLLNCSTNCENLEPISTVTKQLQSVTDKLPFADNDDIDISENDILNLTISDFPPNGRNSTELSIELNSAEKSAESQSENSQSNLHTVSLSEGITKENYSDQQSSIMKTSLLDSISTKIPNSSNSNSHLKIKINDESHTKLNNIGEELVPLTDRSETASNQKLIEHLSFLNNKFPSTSIKNNLFNSLEKEESNSINPISPLDIKFENFYLEKAFQMRFTNDQKNIGNGDNFSSLLKRDSSPKTYSSMMNNRDNAKSINQSIDEDQSSDLVPHKFGWTVVENEIDKSNSSTSQNEPISVPKESIQNVSLIGEICGFNSMESNLSQPSSVKQLTVEEKCEEISRSITVPTEKLLILEPWTNTPYYLNHNNIVSSSILEVSENKPVNIINSNSLIKRDTISEEMSIVSELNQNECESKQANKLDRMISSAFLLQSTTSEHMSTESKKFVEHNSNPTTTIVSSNEDLSNTLKIIPSFERISDKMEFDQEKLFEDSNIQLNHIPNSSSFNSPIQNDISQLPATTLNSEEESWTTMFSKKSSDSASERTNGINEEKSSSKIKGELLLERNEPMEILISSNSQYSTDVHSTHSRNFSNKHCLSEITTKNFKRFQTKQIPISSSFSIENKFRKDNSSDSYDYPNIPTNHFRQSINSNSYEVKTNTVSHTLKLKYDQIEQSIKKKIPKYYISKYNESPYDKRNLIFSSTAPNFSYIDEENLYENHQSSKYLNKRTSRKLFQNLNEQFNMKIKKCALGRTSKKIMNEKSQQELIREYLPTDTTSKKYSFNGFSYNWLRFHNEFLPATYLIPLIMVCNDFKQY